MSITPTSAVFPALKARNLNGRTLALPAEFAGARNVVIVAFRRWHQSLVDSWFPALAPLLAAHPDVRAYELPMLAGGYALARPFIDGGMARAIPDPAVRERTLTVYTNVAQSQAALQISNPETITILLVAFTNSGAGFQWTFGLASPLCAGLLFALAARLFAHRPPLSGTSC